MNGAVMRPSNRIKGRSGEFGDSNVSQELRRKTPTKKSYIEYVILGIIAFAVLLVIVYNYMQVSAITIENSDLKIQLGELKSEERRLKAKHEQIFTLDMVEEKAKSEYGMVKLDRAQIKYFETVNPEIITVNDSQKEVPGFVRAAIKSFNIVVEYLN